MWKRLGRLFARLFARRPGGPVPPAGPTPTAGPVRATLRGGSVRAERIAPWNPEDIAWLHAAEGVPTYDTVAGLIGTETWGVEE